MSDLFNQQKSVSKAKEIKIDFEECSECKRLVKDLKNVKLNNSKGGFMSGIKTKRICTACIVRYNGSLEDKENVKNN